MSDKELDRGPLGQLDDKTKLHLASAALSSMTEGYAFHDLEGKIIDYNQAACRILPVAQGQCENKKPIEPDWKMIREDGSEFPVQHSPVTISIKTGKPCFGVIMGLKLYTGQTRWVQVNTEAVVDRETSETIGAVATFSDVTQQIVLRKALEKEHDSPDAKLMSARLELQKLLVDFAGPTSRMEAQVSYLKGYLKSVGAPETVMKGVARLEATSEKLSQLSAELNQ